MNSKFQKITSDYMKNYYFYNETTDYCNEYFENAEKKIFELSRHLQTYLNHRESIILTICGEILQSTILLK